MGYGSLFSTKLIADGRFQEALEATAREIVSASGDPEPYFNRGRAFAGLARWADAVEDYARALERDAGASAVDPAEIDDELFFALRQWAVLERDGSKDERRSAANPARVADADARDTGVAAGLAILERYLDICPEGRHVQDLETWRDHLRGVERVWVRERV